MRKTLMFVLIVGLGLGMTSASHSADTPKTMNVQGRLTDSTGSPLPTPAGGWNFNFKIHDAELLGTGVVIWPDRSGEDQTITTDDDGLWNALIGAVKPLSHDVFSDTVRWLEITVSGGVGPETILPRVRLVTGPYAYRVATVDGALGGNIRSKVSIGTGHNNSGSDAFVAGSSNSATGPYTTVSGGTFNDAGGDWSAIGGGYSNIATGNTATVGGGSHDTADGYRTAITGGEGNRAFGSWSSVLGGFQNKALGWASTIGGGGLNRAHGKASVVCGGGLAPGAGTNADSNAAQGDYSTVCGGRGNIAGGNYSFAAGRRARANHNGTFVWSDQTNVNFTSSAADQFLIQATGGVGINTSNPYEDLTVNGTIGFKNGTSAMMYIYQHGSTNPDRYILSHSPGLSTMGLKYNDGQDRMQFWGGGTSRLTVGLGDGRIGVGVISPTTILQVVQSSSTDPIADAWTVYSSRRWKENIQPIDDALGKVLALRGVTFDWKANGQHDIGLIAEEVGAVIPEVVTFEENGVDAQSVDYARLVALVIEGMKEQQAQVEDQQDMIDQLQRRVQDLEREL